MILEITGLPGSGKSTLSQTLSESGFVPVILDKGEKWLLLLSFIFKHPFLFCSLLFRTKIEGLRKPRLFFYKIFLLMSCVVRTEKAIQKAKKGERIVLEEGLLHYFLSLYEKKATEKEVIFYINNFVFSDFFVVLDCSMETCLSRIKDRNLYPRSGFGVDYEIWFKILHFNLNLYKSILVKKYAKQTILIDSNRNFNEGDTSGILEKLSA